MLGNARKTAASMLMAVSRMKDGKSRLSMQTVLVGEVKLHLMRRLVRLHIGPHIGGVEYSVHLFMI